MSRPSYQAVLSAQARVRSLRNTIQREEATLGEMLATAEAYQKRIDDLSDLLDIRRRELTNAVEAVARREAQDTVEARAEALNQAAAEVAQQAQARKAEAAQRLASAMDEHEAALMAAASLGIAP